MMTAETGLLAPASGGSTGMRLPFERTIAFDALSNLIGFGAPAFAALFVVRPLMNGIGADRFAVLTLGWVLIGYFTVLDLGLGRALTNLGSERVGARNTCDLAGIVAPALVIMVMVGAIGAAGLAAGCSWLTATVLKVPRGMQAEATRSFYLCAACVPVVILSAGLRGVLEGYRQFTYTNAVRTITGVGSFLGPLVAFKLSGSLPALIGTIVLCRAAACVGYGAMVARTLEWSGNCARRTDALRRLMAFGGWITVSNIISPVMVYGDRFLIGALLSLADIAYYGIAFEVVNRLLMIPGALSAALFPAFGSIAASHGPAETSVLYRQSIRFLFGVLCPVTLMAAAFGRELFALWLGPTYPAAAHSAVAVLALGALFNGLATVPFALIQANGRPDLTAKLHLAEVLPFVVIAYLCTRGGGLTGTAAAWTARVVFDAVMLLWMARKWGSANLLKETLISGSILVFCVTIYLSLTNQGFALRLAVACSALAMCAKLAWNTHKDRRRLPAQPLPVYAA